MTMDKFNQSRKRAGRSPAVWAPDPNRRAVLKGMAATAMTATAGALGPGKARAAGSMNYMCWEGYNDPRIVDPFEETNDVSINFDLIVDSPGGFAKLAAGGHRDFDVVSTDSPWVQRMGPANICEFIDPAEFQDVYDKFYPQFQPPFEPLQFDGKTTGLPTRWGWVGPCINTETSDPDEWKTWDAAFDSKNKDKIGIMDWGDWPIMPMALYAGIDPYKELDQAELDEIRKVLRALFANSRALFSDLSLSQKALLDGSVKTLVGTGTYSTSGLRKAGYENIVAVVPEGNENKQGIIWLEATAIVKTPADIDLAKAMMRHVTNKEAAYALTLNDFTSNPSPNRAVEALYTEEERSVLQLDYVDTVWENSVLHKVAPNIDDLLVIWQEELANAN
ncbi:extracellular solute-binding protein [Rhodobacteraceae bacterium F11138]|nr:extracellular solute-binding protein [Rhodobacteraceae bacterium F11138]